MHLTDPIEILPDCRLWLAEFDALEDEPGGDSENELLEAQLSNRELRRWQQYRPEQKKRQFLNSRRAVRAVLQREFESDSELIQFDSDAQGRPVLLSGQLIDLPQISISHSAGSVAIAVSDAAIPAGVDIEIAQPLRLESLQRIALHPHEQDWCDAQGGQKTEALLTLWTIKEAVWKTLEGNDGIGIYEIILDLDDHTLGARIRNSKVAGTELRLRCFCSQCIPFFSNTICSESLGQPLRGCVAQRIISQE